MQYQPLPKHQAISWGADLLFLTICLGLLFFFCLGTRPLFVPDEGRYAEIAREMITRGDFVTPYLNDIKYFEKPPFFYWAGAFAFKLGGINLWAIRAVNAFLGLLSCLITYITARTLYDRATGLLAAMLLGTSILYFVMTHMVSLDLPVTVFLSICLYSFLLGSLAAKPHVRRYYFWIAAGSAALSVLTKGLIGIIFPVLIITIWIILCKEWRILKILPLFSALLLFLLIALPWHVVVQYRNPEFFYFYIIEQHFLRYTSPDVGHYQPLWFFIPCLILGFFPYSVFLVQTLWQTLKDFFYQRKAASKEMFFLLWAGLIFTFFTFSKSKLIPYILPIFPPLALLCAVYLRKAFTSPKKTGVIIGFIGFVIIAIIIFISFKNFTQHGTLPDMAQARLLLTTSAWLLLIGSLFSLFLSFKNTKQAIMLTIGTMWTFLAMIISAAPAIDARSIYPLAQYLNAISTSEEVITYNRYYQDLPFYLKRRVSILNWRNELSYGMRYQDTGNWLIDDSLFWQRFHGRKRVFVLIDLDEYRKLQKLYPQEHFYFLQSTVTTALISNQSNEQAMGRIKQ